MIVALATVAAAIVVTILMLVYLGPPRARAAVQRRPGTPTQPAGDGLDPPG